MDTTLEMTLLLIAVFLLTVSWVLILTAPLATPLISSLATRFRMTNHGPVQVFKKMKILVVDDDSVSVVPLLIALKKTQFPTDLYFVQDVHTALTNLQDHKFDLVILDYMMPELNGDQLLFAADQVVDLQHSTPVVFYTSNDAILTSLSLEQYSKFVIKDTWGKSLSLPLLQKRIADALPMVS